MRSLFTNVEEEVVTSPNVNPRDGLTDPSFRIGNLALSSKPKLPLLPGLRPLSTHLSASPSGPHTVRPLFFAVSPGCLSPGEGSVLMTTRCTSFRWPK